MNWITTMVTPLEPDILECEVKWKKENKEKKNVP